MHAIIAIVPSPATEKGALDGFEAICSCGYRLKSSLRTCAMSDGHRHVAYMNEKESAKPTRKARRA
jgi:hypothetical protein